LIERNPATGKSIWHIRVEQDDGWSSSLTVLKFPVARIYDAHNAPVAMLGRIVIEGKKSTVGDEQVDLSGKPHNPLDSVTDMTQVQVLNSESTELSNVNDDPGVSLRAQLESLSVERPLPSKNATDLGGFLEVKSLKKSSPKSQHTAQGDGSKSDESKLLASEVDLVAERREPDLKDLDASNIDAPVLEYLDESEKTASDLAKELTAKASKAGANRQLASKSKEPAPVRTLTVGTTTVQVFKPVTPGTSKQLEKLKPPKEAPVVAVKFIEWLQQGIGSGDILINDKAAMVHFAQITHAAVDDGAAEQLMLLVTPLCFKSFVAEHPDYGDSKAVQSAFLKAKWHVTAEPGHINILRFRTGGTRLLSCIGVRSPENFVNPVPNMNELLVYDDGTTRSFLGQSKASKLEEKPHELPERSLSAASR
jgi:Putative conjugal transfer nickase/helicase TraI C-term